MPITWLYILIVWGSKLCIGDSSYIMQENAKKQLASLCNIPYSYINRIEVDTLNLWTSITILLYRISEAQDSYAPLDSMLVPFSVTNIGGLKTRMC